MRYYLTIRPISENTEDVEGFVDKVVDATGFNAFEVRLKLVGQGIRVLVTNTEKALLEKIAAPLTLLGVPNIILNEDEIKNITQPLHASSIVIEENSITFNSRENKPVASLNSNSKCLLVITSMEAKAIHAKHITRASLSPASNDTETLLKNILAAKPIMDIYISGGEAPVRIDSTNFNYKSLDELKSMSTIHNFKAVINELSRVSSSALIDASFGATTLPFVHIDQAQKKEHFLTRFTTYSNFIYRSVLKGLYRDTHIKNEVLTLPVLTLFSGLLWGGPLLMGKQNKTSEKTTDKGTTKLKPTLPPPPAPPVIRRFSSFINISETFNRIAAHKHFIRSLGPPLLLYPMIILIAISAILSQAIENISPLLCGILPLGIILFTHSFALLSRKRAIENCPTSKIKTMPMGEVELNGIALPKYYLRSPYTMTECVYFSYKVYNQVRTKNGTRSVLKEWGVSSNIPFYLKDDSGITLINPAECIVKAGESQTIRNGSYMNPYSKISLPINTKVVEVIIPTHKKLYIIGYAKRRTHSVRDRAKAVLDRLRNLKSDQGVLHERYDKDQNGKIDIHEWDEARNDVHNEVLEETMSGKVREDPIEVGPHPSGGLFYISNEPENYIIKSLSWKVPIYFVLGIGFTVSGAYYTLQLAKNKDIFNLLSSLVGS
ncbi:MAG: hypothetical protein KAR06_06760 [Deltaproteobacteria bacterium]|nr:hypothetical protein [Deltaproteobacteria bacterium]